MYFLPTKISVRSKITYLENALMVDELSTYTPSQKEHGIRYLPIQKQSVEAMIPTKYGNKLPTHSNETLSMYWFNPE